MNYQNKIKTSPQYDFKDVLIEPCKSSVTTRSNVFLERLFTFKQNNTTLECVPIIAANMDTTGTFEVYDVLSKKNIITAFHKFYTKDDYLRMGNNLHPDLFMVSTGISNDDFTRLVSILECINCRWICIDIANGYLSSLLTFCQRVRTRFPDKIIVAGNVATKEGVIELIARGGVDVVKVGIGPGSACTTRLKTGVGVPQLSSILECAEMAHLAGGYIIADGGITCPGDLGKALGAGADFVMMGGQFAGHDENPGEIIEDESDGKKYKLFYGMSSERAMKKHYGGMASYRSSEGRSIKIPYKGALIDTVNDYLGGLRSTCTYVGANRVELLFKKVFFRVVSQQVNRVFA
jgi:GMP reductase